MQYMEEQISEDMEREVEKFWDNPQNILYLIDLIFLSGDAGKKVIAS